MTRMIHVAPVAGKRIIDPFTRQELKAGIMPDDPYWRRREAEGGVVITEHNPVVTGASPAKPAAPSTPASKPAASQPKATTKAAPAKE